MDEAVTIDIELDSELEWYFKESQDEKFFIGERIEVPKDRWELYLLLRKGVHIMEEGFKREAGLPSNPHED